MIKEPNYSGHCSLTQLLVVDLSEDKKETFIVSVSGWIYCVVVIFDGGVLDDHIKLIIIIIIVVVLLIILNICCNFKLKMYTLCHA